MSNVMNFISKAFDEIKYDAINDKRILMSENDLVCRLFEKLRKNENFNKNFKILTEYMVGILEEKKNKRHPTDMVIFRPAQEVSELATKGNFVFKRNITVGGKIRRHYIHCVERAEACIEFKVWHFKRKGKESDIIEDISKLRDEPCAHKVFMAFDFKDNFDVASVFKKHAKDISVFYCNLKTGKTLVYR